MTDDLRTTITQAFRYLHENDVIVSPDLITRARMQGVKAGEITGDLSSVNKKYHDYITRSLTTFFEGGAVTGPRNQMKQAMSTAFLDAFELGWTDGGAELPLDEDGLAWLGARQSQEFGYIDMLFQEAKDLRKEEGFDSFAWTTARADGYTNSLKEVYNNARMRAMPNQMVTFDGDDGQESCPDCQKLKGKRHKISWFVARNYVPPFGTGLECHRGGHCQHGLKDEKGNWVTI